MQWLALHNLWLTAIIPAIIILYVLKRKYEPVEVSSILLWQQLLREQEANKPWQKLRRNLLLFLQLLVACLLILALLRPAIPMEGALAEHTVVVLDTSGSMLALEGEETRFMLAKRKLEEVITNLGSKQTVTLLEIGQEPNVWLANSGDKQALREGLKQLEVRPGSGNHQAALSLATAIAQSDPGSGIMWFGDGHVSGSGDPSLLAGFDPNLFEQVSLGQNKENVAISTFVTQLRDGMIEGLIRLDNYGLRQKAAQLNIYNDQEQLVDSVAVQLQGGRSFTHSLANLPASSFYSAKLDIEGDGLAEDNQLWSVPFSQGEIKAVLVSPEGNRFLSQALTLGSRLQLERMSKLPDEWPQDVDLWIFDGVVPEELPTGNLLLVGPDQATSWLPYEGTQEVSAGLEKVKEQHPLLEHAEWSDLYVAQVSRFGTMPEMDDLVRSGEESILLAGQLEGRRTVLLAFDPHDSDFPLRTSFPIFIQQAISWLAPIQSLPIGTAYPGERLFIPLTPGAEERSILQPDGKQVEVEAAGATSYLYEVPEQLGLYQLEEVRGSERIIRYFSVQMKASESNIALEQIPLAKQGEALPVGEGGALVHEGANGEQAEDKEKEQQQTLSGSKELSKWLAALALLFVALEWVVYQRGY